MPQLGTMMPNKEREESIPSIHTDAIARVAGLLARVIGTR
jgi:hypothetical protein